MMKDPPVDKKRKKKEFSKPMKPKRTPATHSEAKRRKEAAKTELEVKLEALQTCFDSLKASHGDSEDRIRILTEFIRKQEKYIAELESRFLNLCRECRETQPETAFSITGDFQMERLMRKMENLEQLIKENVKPETNKEEDEEKVEAPKVQL